MIVTRTPLRVSLLGGGTDFPAFYAEEPGSVLSLAIDKHIYTHVLQRFEPQVRVSYTRTEIVNHAAAVEHDLVREVLLASGLERQLEIVTMADIPSRGSGLGSSSAVTVGLLKALSFHLDKDILPCEVAEAACHIEMTCLGNPVGKQDQYAAAYGGVLFIEFGPGRGPHEVQVTRLDLDAGRRQALADRLMLFHTGQSRQSRSVLADQQANIDRRRPELRHLVALAHAGRRALEDGALDELGALLHEAWTFKQRLSDRISTGQINAWYDVARHAGAQGGKICGAGGGGFLLIYAAPESHDAVRAALDGLQELRFGIQPVGSEVILDDRSGHAVAAAVAPR